MKTPMAVTAAKAKYESADSALDSFIKQHRDIFEEYELLAIHRNETLGAFKVVVSDNADKLGSKFGPWKISVPRALDPEALVEALGEAVAKPYLHVRMTVDSKAYDRGVSSGAITLEIQEVVESKGSPRLLGPHTVSLYSR